MSPKLVQLFEAVSAFLQPGCDVFVHKAVVVSSLWVFGLWGDDDSKVFCLVFDFDFLWGVGACECGRVGGWL